MSDLRTSIESGRPPRKKWPWLAAGAARGGTVALGIYVGECSVASAPPRQSTTAAGAFGRSLGLAAAPSSSASSTTSAAPTPSGAPTTPSR